MHAARVASGRGELALVIITRIVEALHETAVGGVGVDTLVAAGRDSSAVGAPGKRVRRTRVCTELALRETRAQAACARGKGHAGVIVEHVAHDRPVCVSTQEPAQIGAGMTRE